MATVVAENIKEVWAVEDTVCVCVCVCARWRACVLTEAMLLVAGVLHFNDKSSMLTRILKRKCSKCHPAVKMRCKQADEKRTKKTK